MRKIQLVGDIHADFPRLQEIVYGFKGTTIVLGDVGLGFVHRYRNPAYSGDTDLPYLLETLSDCQFNREQMVFIRGNHDNPEFCRKHHNYLGEYGVFKDIFYVGGAWSIDKWARTEDVDWWPDEELSMEQAYACLDQYKATKPKIVISHECPSSVLPRLHSEVIETRTGQLLQAMQDAHQPEFWYFAHHHTSWRGTVNNTNFRCLDCYETVKL
jgi:hypothetical protein